MIEGFTLGIAAIIFLQQVPAALGVRQARRARTPRSSPSRAVGDAVGGDGSWPPLALVALVAARDGRRCRGCTASLPGVAARGRRRHGRRRASPACDVAAIGALPAIAAGAVAARACSAPRLGELLSAAFAVAALAAIESLLSAKVADGMADAPRHDPDRELFGQGLANLVSPLFGGMPATGAIARTAVNVRAGARTRARRDRRTRSCCSPSCYLGGSLVAEIPLAALAGVLMVTAVRMVERPQRARRPALHPLATPSCSSLTAAATVAFDLIVAVEIGVAVAAVLALRNVARSATVADRAARARRGRRRRRAAACSHEHIVAYRLDGALFFGAAQRFLTELTAVTDVARRDPAPARPPGARRHRRPGARRDRRRARAPAHHRAAQGPATRTPAHPARRRRARPPRPRAPPVRRPRRRHRPRPSSRRTRPSPCDAAPDPETGSAAGQAGPLPVVAVK